MPKADFKHALRDMFPNCFTTDEKCIQKRVRYAVIDSAMLMYAIPQKNHWFKTGRDLVEYMINPVKEVFNMRKSGEWNVDMAVLTQDIGAYVPISKGVEQERRQKNLDKKTRSSGKVPEFGIDSEISYEREISDDAFEVDDLVDEADALRVSQFDPAKDRIDELLDLDKDVAIFRAIMARRDIRTLAVSQVANMIQRHARIPVGKVLVLDGELACNQHHAPIAIIGTGMASDPEVYTMYIWKCAIGEADLRIAQICNEIFVDVHADAIRHARTCADYIRKNGVRTVSGEESRELQQYLAVSEQPLGDEFTEDLQQQQMCTEHSKTNCGRCNYYRSSSSSSNNNSAKNAERSERPDILAFIEDTDFLIISLLQYSQRRVPSLVESADTEAQSVQQLLNMYAADFINNVIVKVGKVSVAESAADAPTATTGSGGRRSYSSAKSDDSVVKRKRTSPAVKVGEYADVNELTRCLLLALSSGIGHDTAHLHQEIAERLFTFSMLGTLKGNDFNTGLPNIGMDLILRTYIAHCNEIGAMFSNRYRTMMSKGTRAAVASFLRAAPSSSDQLKLLIERNARDFAECIGAFENDSCGIDPWNVLLKSDRFGAAAMTCVSSSGNGYVKTLCDPGSNNALSHMKAVKKMLCLTPSFSRFCELIKWVYFKKYATSILRERSIASPLFCSLELVRSHVDSHTLSSPTMRIPSTVNLHLMFKRLYYTFWYWSTYDPSMPMLDEFQVGYTFKDPKNGRKKSNIRFETEAHPAPALIDVSVCGLSTPAVRVNVIDSAAACD